MSSPQAMIMQGLLAADASADPLARTGLAALPRLRHPPEPHEPNTCTICELMFTRVMKARKIPVDVSVLFADLRDYGAVAVVPTDTVSVLLDVFYDECADAIWEFDGLLNKTIGDAVMAIFNFPHPAFRPCGARRGGCAGDPATVPRAPRVPRGQASGRRRAGAWRRHRHHSGQASFGEFGQPPIAI